MGQGADIELGIVQQVLDHIGQLGIFLFFLDELVIVVEPVRIEQAQPGKVALLAELFRCCCQKQ